MRLGPRTQMVACCKIHAIMPLTLGIPPSLSPSRETSGIYPMFKRNDPRPKEDSSLDLHRQVNHRRVGSNGTTLPWVYHHRSVSRREYLCSMNHRLTPAQMGPNGFPKANRPAYQGCALHRLLYSPLCICVYCLVQTKACAAPARCSSAINQGNGQLPALTNRRLIGCFSPSDCQLNPPCLS